MPQPLTEVSKEKALIFRITHRRNISFILKNGLHCAKSPIRDPHFEPIGNLDLIQKRRDYPIPAPFNGTLSDYIPFYFTPMSIMLFNIVTGRNVKQQRREDIVILVSSLPKLAGLGIPFIFSDRHAKLDWAAFSNNMGELDRIDWEALQNRRFSRDPNNPERFERYQAEALIQGRLPINGLIGMACYSNGVVDEMRRLLVEADVDMMVKRRDWFF